MECASSCLIAIPDTPRKHEGMVSFIFNRLIVADLPESPNIVRSDVQASQLSRRVALTDLAYYKHVTRRPLLDKLIKFRQHTIPVLVTCRRQLSVISFAVLLTCDCTGLAGLRYGGMKLSHLCYLCPPTRAIASACYLHTARILSCGPVQKRSIKGAGNH